MRIDTVSTKIFPFGELSDESKETAIQKLWDINVSCEWWENTYYDAEQVLLKLESFDDHDCSGKFIEDAKATAEKIMSEHGKNCNTLLTAREYMANRTKLVVKYSDGIKTDIVAEDNEYDFDNDCNDLDAEFLKSILEDYRIILQKERDYQTSEEAIVETIKANEYEFTEDGEIY